MYAEGYPTVKTVRKTTVSTLATAPSLLKRQNKAAQACIIQLESKSNTSQMQNYFKPSRGIELE